MTPSETSDPRVWFITGASSGMGHALAREALRHGDRVVATARNTTLPDELAADFPGKVLVVKLDVRDEEAARRAAEKAVEAFGRIDVVLNNAGYAALGSVEGSTDRQVREMFDTGFFGVLNVLRATLPVMRRQRSGHVLQMSSIFAHMSFPATGIIAAAKQAVGGATQAMAAELAPLGVKCTLIEPGALNTRFIPKGKMAETAIPDYQQTVESTLELMGSLPREAVGDISRVAAAIVEVVESDDPPMHLVLGGWAQQIIRQELAERVADLDNWSALTLAVDQEGRLPTRTAGGG